jgi:hypothetical protein
MTTKYLHTLVYKIDGIQLGPEGGEIEIIADNAARFRAVVSTDPDNFCFEGDRWSALANLWLNALFGQPGLEISSERITEELEKIRESRKSQFGTGPYLIFVRDGEIEDFSSAELVVVSRSSVGRWKWQRGEQLFDLPDVVCKPRRHRR